MNPSSKHNPANVCLVHDWLIAMRGGEKVLEAIAEYFPEAPIYTLFTDRTKLSPFLKSREIRTSFLQHIPGIHKWYRWLLPIFPIAIRSLNLQQFDLIVSTSHCVAKSVKVRKGAVHICYCHTPVRYAWDLGEDYLRAFPAFIQYFVNLYFKWFRSWDKKTAQDVTCYISNSINIKNKIMKYYGREATVIYPPVTLPGSVDLNLNDKQAHGSYFLSIGALVPYKRIDLIIDAFNKLDHPLIIIGDGPCRNQLQQAIQNPNIQFKGWVGDDELIKYYKNARALIFPGEEDFGMVPVEIQLTGKPVVAYGKGGALETVIDSKTGIFFHEQTVESLVSAVKQFEATTFDPEFIRAHANKFSKKRFMTEFSANVDTSRSSV